MASTIFVDKVTVINTAWLNDTNALVWTVFNGKTTAGTSGTLLRSNGTNIVNTTATYPTTAGTSGTILRSDGTNLVNSTATYPATTTANQLLYSSATNTITGLTSANSSVLVTNGSGVPSLSATLPAVTLDTATVAVTQTFGDSSTKIATTAFVAANAVALYGGGAIYQNDQNVSVDTTIASGNNGFAAGPLTIDSGITVTVSSGSSFIII
jgi:hypothetical protein